MRKYIAEFIGTFTLVFMGCGTAMLVGCDPAEGTGYLLTALAFGLSIVACAYSIGNISGCHVNPAVSLAVLINGGLTAGEFGLYCLSQVLGAIFGSGALAVVFKVGFVNDATGGYGSNALAGVGYSAIAGLLVEFILTFIFVMTILGVTSEKAGHGSFGGLIIGLTLTFVHIFGIGLTGTSVNPARSLAPAIFCAIAGDTSAIASLWVFIVGPFAGAAAAAFVYRALENEE